jgi:hypothetical protein
LFLPLKFFFTFDSDEGEELVGQAPFLLLDAVSGVAEVAEVAGVAGAGVDLMN